MNAIGSSSDQHFEVTELDAGGIETSVSQNRTQIDDELEETTYKTSNVFEDSLVYDKHTQKSPVDVKFTADVPTTANTLVENSNQQEQLQLDQAVEHESINDVQPSGKFSMPQHNKRTFFIQA